MGMLHFKSLAVGTTVTVLLMCKIQDTEAQSCQIQTVPSVPVEKFSRDGDLNIGIVLPLHRYDPSSGQCSTDLLSLGVLQRLEAMIFAIDEINKNKSLLPNITLGFSVVDDCENEFIGLARALHFIQTTGTCQEPAENTTFYPVKVVAVIGTENSAGTEKMADLMNIYEIPQLSYVTSSQKLDDFPFFFRLVPSYVMQISAVVDILKAFKWTFISVVFSHSEYAHLIFVELSRKLNQLGYCIGAQEEIEETTNFEEVVDRLLAKKRARVVFLVLTKKHAHQLFIACELKGCAGNLTWICSEELCDDYTLLTTFKVQISGLLMLNFIEGPVARFDEYFENLTLATVSGNPFLQAFFKKIFCIKGQCKQNVAIKTSSLYKKENRVSLVMDCVYAIAHALSALLLECNADAIPVHECMTSSRIRHALLNINFQGEHANIAFKADGSVEAGYRITNAFLEDGEIKLMDVGEWSTTNLSFTYFNKDDINWGWISSPQSRGNGELSFPVSECSLPCSVGWQAVVTKPSCCWYCERCAVNQRTMNIRGVPRCISCPSSTNFTWPDSKTRTKCLPIPITRIRIEDINGKAVLACVVVMEVMSLFVILFFVKFCRHPLIIGFGRVIAFFLIVGQVGTSLLAATFTLDFSPLMCILPFVGVHLSCTLNYAPMLVKIISVYNMDSSIMSHFKRSELATSQGNKMPLTIPSYKKMTLNRFPGSMPSVSLSLSDVKDIYCGNCITQGLAIFFIISFQLALLSCGVILNRNEEKVLTLMPNYFNKYVERKCVQHNFFVIAPMTYNFLLLFICAYFIFKVQSKKAKFYEARFLEAYIFSSALLWLAFFPGYLSTTTYTLQRLWFIGLSLLNNLTCQILVLWTRIIGICMKTSFKSLHTRAT